MQTTPFPTRRDLAERLLAIVEEYRQACTAAGDREPSFRAIEVGAGVMKGFLSKIQRIANGGTGDGGFTLDTAETVANYVAAQMKSMAGA